MKYPLILSHIYKERVWGGSRLKKDAEPPIGEVWVLSVRDDDNSIVLNGAFAGMTLADVLKNQPELLGKADFGEKFPLLIKFIDSKETLSIQVHPDDKTAAHMGGEGGKTEMWYIIDAKPDAYIYYGVRDDVDIPELRSAVLSGEDPTHLLKKVNVKAGDCYFIAAGTPHAIGGGIYLCEIQQNSDTTFRMYDYGRPRELHLNEAAESLKKTASDIAHDENILACCEYFTSELISLDGEYTISADPDKFISLCILEGGGAILDHSFGERDSVFLPAGAEKYILKGKAQIIKTTI